jgi:ABC-type multidrug transport system fused ATPase/permease subunit
MNFILLKIYNLKQQELDKLYEVWMNRVNNYQWIKFWFNGIASIANLFFLFLLLGSLRYIWFGIAAWSIDLWFLFVLTGVFTHARSELYRLGLFVAELSEKLTYIQRFDDITSQKHIQPDTSGYNYPVWWSVSYNAVWFGYEGGTGDLLLEDFSLTIQSGQKVAIVW